MKQQAVLPRTTGTRCHSTGFTLIELMVVIAIVAILAAIGFPSYTDYSRRGQVQEAPASLAGFRTQMEQYYQDNRNYGTGAACGLTSIAPGAKYFSYSCALTNSGQGYTVTATGISGSLTAGLAYTIDQLNNQATTCTGCSWGFAGTQSSWVLRKP